LQSLQDAREQHGRFRIVRSNIHERADAPHALALLCARRKRPRRRAAEKGDELAAFQDCLPSLKTKA
jgi:hypothetical protein